MIIELKNKTPLKRFFNLFKKTEKIKNTIESLNLYMYTTHVKSKPKKVKDLNEKIKNYKRKIIEAELKIKGIEEDVNVRSETIFKPLANQIANLLAIITGTEPRFVYNPIGGSGFSLELDGVSIYRIYLEKSYGIALHTWRYKNSNIENIKEYNNIEPIFIKINGSIIHTFSQYKSDTEIIKILEEYCKVDI